jgi:hypothetical protein
MAKKITIAIQTNFALKLSLPNRIESFMLTKIELGG